MTRLTPADEWRRLCRVLLLPLLLLCAQQGALLHGLSHYRQAQTQGEGEDRNGLHGVCELCLAFSGVQLPAGFAAPPPSLRADLGFAPAAATPAAPLAAAVPVPRSRGPPFFC